MRSSCQLPFGLREEPCVDRIFHWRPIFFSTLVATPRRSTISPFLGLDAVIVGLRRERDGTFKPDIDLVVGEFERLEVAELGAEMLGQIIGVAALDAAVLENLRIAVKSVAVPLASSRSIADLYCDSTWRTAAESALIALPFLARPMAGWRASPPRSSIIVFIVFSPCYDIRTTPERRSAGSIRPAFSPAARAKSAVLPKARSYSTPI